jgi:hypothetical protein
MLEEKGRYTYKGFTYKIIEFTSLKHPETRDWIPAVIYEKEDKKRIYVRTEADFLERFTRI